MELQHGTKIVRNLEAISKTTARVEARLEPRVGIKRILQTEARVFLSGHEREDTEVRINGRVVTRVIFIDEADSFNSEERTNNFSEKIILSNSAMVGEIMATAHVLEAKVVDNTAQIADAQVQFEITLLGLTAKEVRFLSGMTGSLEFRTEKVRVNTWGQMVTSRFEVEERIDLDKSCEGVLSVDVIPTLREIVVGEGKATAKGQAIINIQAVKKGEEQSIYNDHIEFDFSKTMQAKFLKIDDSVLGQVSVSNIEIRAESKDSPQLVVSAELEFKGFSVTAEDVDCIADAFGFSNHLELRTSDIESLLTLPTHHTNIEVDSNLAMGEKSVFITRIHSVGQSTVSTLNILPVNDKVTIEGALSTNVIFECEERQIHSHAIKVPFSSAIKIEGVTATHTIQAKVDVTQCKVRARRGRELLVDARLSVALSATTQATTRLATDVISGEARAADDSAILIYTVADGETEWDIAKRLNCPLSEVSIQDGRVFIYRQHLVNF
ncbi:MAG: DUF3794 domain-containing protein [Firmicutes bacterium]|nr:DUF3794 domain-containing protein [Bacillota bacterium]